MTEETIMCAVMIIATGIVAWSWFRVGESRGFVRGVEKTIYEIKEAARKLEEQKSEQDL